MTDRCLNWQLRDPAMVLEREQGMSPAKIQAVEIIPKVKDRYTEMDRRMRLKRAIRAVGVR